VPQAEQSERSARREKAKRAETVETVEAAEAGEAAGRDGRDEGNNVLMNVTRKCERSNENMKEVVLETSHLILREDIN
jgi:uncharacterized protein HemY